MTIILSLYPNTRGLGYICLETPQKLLDSGVVTVRPIFNGRIMQRVQKFTEYFKPTLVIIRDHNYPTTARNKRTKELIDEIVKYAEEKNIRVYRYSRQQIKDVFQQFGAITKYEIAKKIIEWFPELAIRAPRIRKQWMDEDYNMGIFDALSLSITHQYLTE